MLALGIGIGIFIAVVAVGLVLLWGDAYTDGPK